MGAVFLSRIQFQRKSCFPKQLLRPFEVTLID